MNVIKSIKYRIKRIPEQLYRIFCVAFDWIAPKRANAIFLASVHGNKYAGNSRYLFEYLVNERPDLDARFYLKVPIEDISAEKVMYPSWKTFWFYLRAKTIFCTHGYDDFRPYFPSRRKTVVQLWHGLPMRKFGILDPNLSERSAKKLKNKCGRWDHVTLPSKEIALRFCCGTGLSYEKVLFTGQPRNDFLVSNTCKELPETAKRVMEGAEQCILYAPTWRPVKPTRWFPFDDLNMAELEQLLEKWNAVILLRPHVTEKGAVSGFYSDRIRDFSSGVCPDVNMALPYMDMLITDYSSICYDFLLLERPVCFFHYDYDEYDGNFGFLFDDPDFWFPGPRPRTGAEFIAGLENVFRGNDSFSDQRCHVNRLINSSQTDNSCSQILQKLNMA